MILRRIIEDGKTKYEEISFEDALEYENKNELVFTDEDEQDEFEDRLEELEDLDDDEDEQDEFEDRLEELEDLDDVEDIHYFNFNFNNQKKTNKNKLVTMLPFLDKEYLKEIVDGIINEEEEYKNLDLVVLFPYIGEEECDRLFKKFIFENKECDKHYITCVAPFVSKETLSNFVDEYTKGNYQNVNVDALYPFMLPHDVKKMFKYIISKKDLEN